MGAVGRSVMRNDAPIQMKGLNHRGQCRRGMNAPYIVKHNVGGAAYDMQTACAGGSIQ